MSQLDKFNPLITGTFDFTRILDKMCLDPLYVNKYHFKRDLLCRLRWNVFGDLAAVEVEDGLDDSGIERRSPLSSHTIATEPITSPPIYALEVCSGDLNDLISNENDESPPETPMTSQTSETPITILDFVTHAHAFLNQYEDGIRALRTHYADTSPERETGRLVHKHFYGFCVFCTETDIHPDFYFKDLWDHQNGDQVRVTLRTCASGEFRRTDEQLWETRRRQAAAQVAAAKEAAVFDEKYNTPDRIRQDILFRLRWDIGGTVEDIELDDGVNDDGTERRVPFMSSALVNESLADPPISHVSILLQDVHESQSFEYFDTKYPYTPLTIHNADKTPITIKDFVEQVHAHFAEHYTYMLRYQEAMNHSAVIAARGNGTQLTLFFRWALSRVCEDTLAVSVKTMMQGEQGGHGDERLWKRQRMCAAGCREVRCKRGMKVSE
jgi:hypothetical protein